MDLEARRLGARLLAIAVLCACPAAQGAGLDAALYLPLEPGDVSQSRQNGLDIVTATVLPTQELVEGVPTWVVETQGGAYSGGRSYATNDASGARIHRFFYADLFVAGLGVVDASLTFTPPVKLADPIIALGNLVESSGTATFWYEGYGSFSLSYASESRFTGFEPVTVPFGPFDALRHEWSVAIEGLIGGQFLRYDIAATQWLAADIGSVKGTLTSPDGTETLELLYSNRFVVPEPGASVLGALAALAGIAVTRRGRRY